MSAPQAKVALPTPYEYEGVLGRGGMGVVYLAKDTNLNRQVAIKFLSASGQEAASLSKRFQREANQLAALRHPNIVGFYDAGYFQKQNYIVMEYVERGSLRSLLQQQEGPLTLQQSLELFAAVSDGLEYIHQQNLVHRDLKPDNILLDENRSPKIGDFGLALKLEDQSRITQSGMILGTYSYLSPEQILSRDVGPAADLYALGCCMYEAITGRPLFSADTEFALLNSHLRQTPIPPRQIRLDIPPELDTLILRLLHKHPAERPETAAEVAKALRRLQQSLRQVWTLPVVGRDATVAELEQHLRPCLLRQPVAVLLTSPPGQGRSCTVRKLVSQLQKASIAVHPMVPLPYQLEPAAVLFKELGGAHEAWLEALSHGGPEAAARLLWKQLEQLGAPRLLIMDDLRRQPQTTNSVIEALCAVAPPPGFGWVISCASHRATSLRPWEGAIRMELGPLDDQALRDVAHLQVSGHLDDELIEGLLFRSSGSVRRLRLWLLALRGAGLVRRQGQLVERDNSQPWPESLWEPLWLQLSARPENEVKLLRIAGLLDDPFPYELIQELSELEEAEAQGALDLLLRDGILEECWGQPGELYQFSSRELKEKLQASATERLKRRVYGRAAQLLEGRASMGILANYLRRAGNDAEALPKFLQAALEAEQSGDLLQAESNWSQALSVCGEKGTPEIRLMAMVGRCEILLKLGRLSEVEATASQELEQALPESAELRRTRRHLAGLVARARWLRGERGRELLEFCQRELDQLAHADYSDSLWLTWCCAGYFMEEGEAEQGLELLNRLPESESLPGPFFWLQGALLRALGRLQEAEKSLLYGLEPRIQRNAAEEVELLLELAIVQVLLGHSADQQGRWLDQAVGRAHEVGDLDLLAEIEWVRGLIHEVQHDMGAALRSYQRVIEVSSAGSGWRAQGHLQLGVALARMARLDEAEKTLQQGLELEVPQLQDQLYLAWGCLEVQRANWDRAREQFASAERHNAGASARLLRCWCLCQLDQKEVAINLMDSLESIQDPLDRWLQRRVNNLLQNVPEPWPPAEDRPWVLRGHPARSIVNRLLPTQRRETLIMQAIPPGETVAGKPSQAPTRGLNPVLALVGLMGLGLIGYGVKQRMAGPVPVVVASATASTTPEPAPETTATPVDTPSAAPTEDFRPPEKVKLSIILVPPKTGWLTVDGEPERLRIENGLFSGKFPSGTHTVTIDVKGYEKDERELPFLEADVLRVTLVPLKVNVNLSANPGPVKVQVDNEPPRRLDGPGTVKGTFPLTFGRHVLKVMKNDYITESKTIEIKSDEPQSVSIKLRPEPPPEPVYRPYDPGPGPSYPAPAPVPAPYYPPPAPAPAPPANPYTF
ncbi:MAG: protein kinase [Candidatus Eremiobacteraeota bacterium]|nr:protein kinase [Candidatus Eremiobacteraeota bacterium]MCW5867007.1 protein kinase [Candidatus Eremiobacteraeota bacterium]